MPQRRISATPVFALRAVTRRARLAYATHLGVEAPEVTTTVTCVDKKRQWSQAGNVKNSVAIRSTIHMLKPGKKASG